jgi:hypothetical protein
MKIQKIFHSDIDIKDLESGTMCELSWGTL